MGNKQSELPPPRVTEHIATNDPELQMYHNFGFIENEVKKDKTLNGIYMIEGYNLDNDGKNDHSKISTVDDKSTTSENGIGAKVDLLEFIRKSFRRKRRLSAGDKPYGLSQKQSQSENETVQNTKTDNNEDDDDDKVLLGRAGVRESSHIAHPRRSIRLTQVAPSNSSIFQEGDERWKIPIHHFSSKKQGPNYKQHSKRMRSYYKAQDELITTFEEIQLEIDDAMENRQEAIRLRKTASCYAKLTFCINLLLLISKTVASVMSGSIAIISSLVDSAVDLVSGIVLWWTNHAVKRRNIYAYPQGRTKLEPIAIVIIAVVMGLASLQLIRESIERIAALATSAFDLPHMDIATMIIAGSTIVIKFVMWLLCRRIDTPSVQALAQDHRNDVLSNTVALICGYLGSSEMFSKTKMSEFSFVDPAGAIIISLYIVYNWWRTGKEQIKLLTGHSAQPEFLSKLTWLSVNHHPKILNIDTVRAFHFGNNFLVEVDIVLPEQMKLKEAHDIGESLQQKIETLPDVERAFVHLDYEFHHSPSSEHKTV